MTISSQTSPQKKVADQRFIELGWDKATSFSPDEVGDIIRQCADAITDSGIFSPEVAAKFWYELSDNLKLGIEPQV
jgi:hypothetical protein|tara:strand:- start:598 stop:825 length:228 start_codon:yes stop_codon:yes gene_type:complete